MKKSLFIPLIALISLASCNKNSNLEIRNEYPKNRYERDLEKSGSFVTKTNKSYNLLNNNVALGKQNIDAKIKGKANPHLWQAAINVCSRLDMKFDSVDSNSGIIVAEDVSHPKERFIYNLVIIGNELKVTVFKQEKSLTGWEEKEVSAVVVKTLTDAIVKEAKLLKK